jgi:putative membrane protein
MMWHWGWGWGMGLGLVGLVFWALVIAVIVLVIVRMTRHGAYHHMGMGDKSPLDIAKERYARGEITKEQFEQIKRDLT